MIGIYKITSPTGKIYIGQSVDIHLRWSAHKIDKVRSKLKSSFKSHGFENHTFEILEECSIELLNERERYWQDFYDVLGPNGLNLRLTKSNDKTGYCSDSMKNKLSEYHKSRTPEQKQEVVRKCLETKSKETPEERTIRLTKISEASKRKVMSVEAKRKISEFHKKKTLSEETKRKIGLGNKGKVISREAIEKMKATKNKIDPLTGLTNAQMSARKNIGRKQTQESKDKFKQTILNRNLKNKQDDN